VALLLSAQNFCLQAEMPWSPRTQAIEIYIGSTNVLQQCVTAVCSDTNYILSIVIDPSNTFTFTFVGTTNAQYRLLQTADPTLPIASWTVVPGSTNIAFDGTWQYTVTNAADAAFFRVEALVPYP
jgi:hypothetical protein